MTHFNHEWNNQNPAIPEAVGDRYYAQDLNDDFNYLKHLPYEIILQGRSRGVMVAPSDTWDNDTNSLTLSGGFGVILQNNICLDPDETFVIPPKTKSSPRYERIPFVTSTLILPNDNGLYYIVATPTKRSLLQRTKTILSESYASRIRYDGVITLQNTAPTAGQILIGLCHNKEYCILIDNDINQCKESIILKKWFGQNGIKVYTLVSALQTYYNTDTYCITTNISIGEMYGTKSINDNCDFRNCTIDINSIYSGYGIQNSGGVFYDCTINIDTLYGGSTGIGSGVFRNCTIDIGTIIGGTGIDDGDFYDCNIDIDMIDSSGYGFRNSSGGFHNCTISIGTISSNYLTSAGVYGAKFYNCYIKISTINGTGIDDGDFYNCYIKISTISRSNSRGINGAKFYNCYIEITTIEDDGKGTYGGTFSNCYIGIITVSGSSSRGISGGGFNNCFINITSASSGSGIQNVQSVYLCLTRIRCSTVTDLSSTGGKLNNLNDTVFHAS